MSIDPAQICAMLAVPYGVWWILEQLRDSRQERRERFLRAAK